jgi:GntR family transcriptional repressor for pyruvate dehydrogenase complex
LPPVLSLSRAPRGSLPEEIVERLVNLIFEEGKRPGDRLGSERTLMVKLKVGRSTLREAVKTLVAFGIIDVAMGSGMFVGEGDCSLLTRPLSWRLLMGERSAREVVEARRVVEVELAGLAATRATEPELEAIAEKLALMQAWLGDASAFARHDVEFHLAIARAGHNQVLYHVLDALQHSLRLWFVEAYRQIEADLRDEQRSQLITWHRSIYEAILSRDPERARRAMADHVDDAVGWLREAARPIRKSS